MLILFISNIKGKGTILFYVFAEYYRKILHFNLSLYEMLISFVRFNIYFNLVQIETNLRLFN